ncbi:MAG: outer membrane protein, partial [Alphaproteobacteria bacterium]
MKRTLLAIAALIAAGTATATAQSTNWTGFYVGVHEGGGWGRAGWDAAAVAGDGAGVGGFPAFGLTQGVFGGGQIGFTVQQGPLVFGAEATLSATNIDGQIECGDGVTYGYICNTRLNALATFTGQVGFSMDRTRFYIAGGAAWALHAQEITEPSYAYGIPCPTCYSWGATTESSWGWTAGFGFERALSHGLSFRTDYRYVRFPTRATTLTSPFWPDTVVTVAQAYHLVSIGLNYRFGQGEDMPLMAYADEHGERWEVEFGQRTWLNFSDYSKNLYATAITPTELVSRLTYGTSIGGAGEGFYRAESPAGFYVAGLLGAGVSGSGLLIDEDFPPYIVPYSRTES